MALIATHDEGVDGLKGPYRGDWALKVVPNEMQDFGSVHILLLALEEV
jgi:hypothetical protein